MNAKEFLVYAAGLFDGEGCVYVKVIKKKGNHLDNFNVAVTIGNACPIPIKMLKERFGGHYRIHRHDLKNPNHRMQFIWLINSRSATDFLEAIYPYTIIKKDEVRIAIALQENIHEWDYRLWQRQRRGGGNGRHPEADAVIAWRYEIKEKMTALKHTRYPANSLE